MFGQPAARLVFVSGRRVLTLRLQRSGLLRQGHATVTIGFGIFCRYQHVVAGHDAPMEADGLDDGSRLRETDR